MRIDKNAVISLAFALLIILIMIAPNPLSVGDSTFASDSEGGNPFRQLAIIFCMSLCILASGAARPVALAIKIPTLVWLFLLWAILSLTWSAVPDVAFRRLLLTAGVIFASFAAVNSLGLEKTLKVLFSVLFLILAADVVSVLLFPGAVHGAGERDRQLIGLWRGLHSHKNIAASVAFFGIMISILSRNIYGNKIRLGLFILSFMVLVGSFSKTTIALLPFIILFVFSYRRASKSKFRRRIFVSTFAAIVLFSFYALMLDVGGIQSLALDPTFLTGRGAIWQVMLDYTALNPLGAGFGSFWNIGFETPAMGMAPITVALMPHGHNGYLDVMVATGYAGLALATAAAIIFPAARYFNHPSPSSQPVMFAGAVVLYSIFHNATEPSIFSGARVDWIFICAAIAILHYRSPVINSSRLATANASQYQVPEAA